MPGLSPFSEDARHVPSEGKAKVFIVSPENPNNTSVVFANRIKRANEMNSPTAAGVTGRGQEKNIE
jgi:hypothetical protein